MNSVHLQAPEAEARELYRRLHQGDGQQTFPELYDQLQRYFFRILTIDELQKLLEETP